jgi:DNA-binding response OmpR family regulator
MLLTARNDSKAIAAGKAAGADAYLAKPFSLGDLLRQVEQLLPAQAHKAEAAR